MIGGKTTTLSKNLKVGIPETIKIKNNTSKGYLDATIGDGIDISGRMQYHRGTVQKEKAQTLSTMGGEDVGTIVEAFPSTDRLELKRQMCNQVLQKGQKKEYDTIRHSYTRSRLNGNFMESKQNNIAPTLDTRCDCIGVVVNDRER